MQGAGPSWIIDAEHEHDGAEPDEADREPSLGWTVDGFVGNEPSELEMDEAIEETLQ